MVNYILARHNWPMVVVRNKNKNKYIDALHETDVVVGPTPSAGAHAKISQIKLLLNILMDLLKRN